MIPGVLVVDDDRAILDALDRALRISGYEVATAADGLGARQAAGAEARRVALVHAGGS